MVRQSKLRLRLESQSMLASFPFFFFFFFIIPLRRSVRKGLWCLRDGESRKTRGIPIVRLLPQWSEASRPHIFHVFSGSRLDTPTIMFCPLVGCNTCMGCIPPSLSPDAKIAARENERPPGVLTIFAPLYVQSKNDTISGLGRAPVG